MTWVDIHAITLLALPIVTIVLLLVLRRRRPRPIDSLFATGTSFFISFVSASCKHMCREGDPYAQWVIPVICLLGIMLFVANATLRRVAAILMFIMLVFLCEQFHDWAHQQEWSGNPAGSRVSEQNYNNSKIKIAEMVLTESTESDANSHPPCWLSELPAIQAAVTNSEHRIDLYCMGPANYVSCWHTRLTGLSLAQGKRDFWYLGGPIKDAKGRIVVRERPASGVDHEK